MTIGHCRRSQHPTCRDAPIPLTEVMLRERADSNYCWTIGKVLSLLLSTEKFSALRNSLNIDQFGRIRSTADTACL